MMMTSSIPIFDDYGVHCVVDGQFGSTGKGALCAWLANLAIDSGMGNKFGGCIYSGGPNSGHTFYLDDEKIVLKQLPTFAVALYLRGYKIQVYLSAGAIIDRDILRAEANRYPGLKILVHPNAAIVTDEDRNLELTGSVAEVAGTRSGTGAALARKILRDPIAIARNSLGFIAANVTLQNGYLLSPLMAPYFMEVAQGYSLGIHSEFYPKVTSRECTVMQGLADARLPPQLLRRTYMAVRTFPIRVGNVDGHSSGNWYPDQSEISWEHLGREPELTTVTQRVRRIATFSVMQFIDACFANMPSLVFVSHMDYLDRDGQERFRKEMEHIRKTYGMRYALLYGYGPKVNDIRSI
jgi:adenylosuccinate synthase